MKPYNERLTQVVGVRLTSQEYKRLKERANALGCTISDILRGASIEDLLTSTSTIFVNLD